MDLAPEFPAILLGISIWLRAHCQELVAFRRYAASQSVIHFGFAVSACSSSNRGCVAKRCAAFVNARVAGIRLHECGPGPTA